LVFVLSFHLEQVIGVVGIAAMRVDQAVMCRAEQHQVVVAVELFHRVGGIVAWTTTAGGSNVCFLAENNGERVTGACIDFIGRKRLPARREGADVVGAAPK
jgi:hypothetical protein